MSGKNKSSKNSDDSPLDYIKINQKNIIEELTESDYIAITANLLKTFSIIEDNIGSEINKFFNILTPESKESDQLKLNLAISSKSKNDNPNLENYLNDILNRPELNYVVLNKELNEQGKAPEKDSTEVKKPSRKRTSAQKAADPDVAALAAAEEKAPSAEAAKTQTDGAEASDEAGQTQKPAAKKKTARKSSGRAGKAKTEDVNAEDAVPETQKTEEPKAEKPKAEEPKAEKPKRGTRKGTEAAGEAPEEVKKVRKRSSRKS
jgi:hypothetical protein